MNVSQQTKYDILDLKTNEIATIINSMFVAIKHSEAMGDDHDEIDVLDPYQIKLAKDLLSDLRLATGIHD